MLSDPSKKGKGPLEYALILVLVTLVVTVILCLLGPALSNIFMPLIYKYLGFIANYHGTPQIWVRFS